MTQSKGSIGHALALAFSAGEWQLEALVARACEALNVDAQTLRPFARLVMRVCRRPPTGRERSLGELIARSHAMRDLLSRGRMVRIRRWFLPEPRMASKAGALVQVAVPELASAADVAAFLHIPLDELDWFADAKRMNRSAHDPRLQHYSYRWLQKRSGRYRLLEAPKQRLKRAQRILLDGVLHRLPPHGACHGHRSGRSVRSFVAEHAGAHVVLALDLREFFLTVSETRVRATFSALGYPDDVAALLARLTCTSTPHDVIRHMPRDPLAGTRDLTERFQLAQRLRAPHLPQGAPTSPALANLAAFRLDVRLSALARSVDATYGRYADDLAFSGGADFRNGLESFIPLVGAIAIEEGFALNFQKTRVMHAAHRQQLCGVTINREPTLDRRELERLEATLYNCKRHGVAEQNRANVADFRAHLRGRVAWAQHLHPRKGARLLALFLAIEWPATEAPLG